MSVEGTWNIVMKTPMGDREASVTLNPDGDALTGTMTSDGNALDIENGRIENGRALWDASVTTPMPLTLSFDCGADGDTLEGSVKLGMFGNAGVTGTRA